MPSISNSCRQIIAVLFLAVSFCTAPASPGMAATDVSSLFKIEYLNEQSVLNRLTREIVSTAEISLTNTSQSSIAVPFHAVITINNPTGPVTMPEALGGPDTPPYNRYYYDLSSQFVATGALDPGKNISFPVKFVRNFDVSFTYTVTPYAVPVYVNQSPTAYAGPPQTITLQQGETSAIVTLDGSGTDPDGSVFGYIWTGNPDPEDVAKPLVSLVPGSYTFSLTVTDDKGAVSQPSEIVVTVNPPNSPPVFTPIDLIEGAEGVSVSFTVTVSDPDSDSVVISVAGLPTGSSFDPDTGIFSWTPGFDQAGVYEVIFTASDGSLTASLPVTITVGDVNRAPVITTESLPAARIGQSYTAQVWATDADKDPLTFTLPTAPAGMTIESAPMIITSTATGGSWSSTGTWIGGIIPSTTDTVVISGGGTVTVDGASVDGSAGIISWKPTAEALGAHEVIVAVSDGKGGSASRTYLLQVPDSIPPSVFLTVPKESIPGSAFTLMGSATDNVGVTEVRLFQGDHELKVFTAPPFTHEVVLPPSQAVGSAVSFRIVARDAMGNSTEATGTTTIVGIPDTEPPTVSLHAPAVVTPGATVTVSADAVDNQGVASLTYYLDGVQVGTASQQSPAVSIPIPALLQQDATVLFSVKAEDFSGNSATDQASATAASQGDASLPQVSVTAPLTVVLGDRIPVSSQVADDVGVALVEVSVNYVRTLSFPRGGDLSFELDPPAGAQAGTEVLIEVVAVDFSGNRGAASRTLTLVAGEVRQGLVSGTVFEDTTGLPLPEATVVLSMAGSPDQTVLADSRGRYAFVAEEGAGRLTITKAGYTQVDRPHVSVLSNQGRRVVDARLTPLAAPGTVSALLGQTVTAPFTSRGGGISSAVKKAGTSVPSGSTISVALIPGALEADGQLSLTQVGAQGLQGRLPNGWSTVAAFDLQPHGVAFTSAQPVVLPNVFGSAITGPFLLAMWDETGQQWKVASTATSAADHATVAALLAGTGQYALVVRDASLGSEGLPAAGAPLPEATLPAVPETAVSVVTPQPKLIFYKPGVSSEVGTRVAGTAPLLSGQPIWANIAEDYSFYTKEHVLGEPFDQDISLFTFGLQNGELLADYIVSPTQSFEGLALEKGVITVTASLPPLTAETVAVIGPQGGTVTGSGGETLTFSAGSVSRFIPVSLALFDAAQNGLALPADFEPVGGISLSLGGNVLVQPAVLSLPVHDGFIDDGKLLLVKVVDMLGSTRLALAGVAAVKDGRLVTSHLVNGSEQQVAFSGIATEGRYLLLKTKLSFGYATGTVSGIDGNPFAGALVTADNLPLVAVSRSGGSYSAAVGAGAFAVTATDVVKRDRGTNSGTVTAEGVVTVDIALAIDPPSVLSVSPADGAANVALADPVRVTFSEPIDPATVTPAAVLLESPAGPVSGTLSLGGDGREAVLRPAAPLEPNTRYILSIAATIRDLAGYAMTAPFAAEFTSLNTEPPPAPPAGTVTATIPTAGGSTTVTATQGTAGLHDTVYIINLTTGKQNQVQVDPNGGFSATVDATVKDRLSISITNPAGATTTVQLPRYQQKNEDGSITAVVGPEGGRIALPEGLYLDVPATAFADGETVRFKSLSQTELGIPDMPGTGYQFVAGFEVSASAPPKKYLDFSAPAPEGYDGSVPGIIAKMETAAGQQVYSVVDTAKLINGRLATSSPPCPGILEIYGRYAAMIVNGPGTEQERENRLKTYGMAVLHMAVPRIQSYVIQPMVDTPIYYGGMTGLGNMLQSMVLGNSVEVRSLKEPASIFLAKVSAATSINEVNQAMIETICGTGGCSNITNVCIPVPGNQPITVAIRNATTGQVMQTQTVNPTVAGSNREIFLSMVDPFDTSKPQIMMTSWDGMDVLENGNPIAIYFAEPVTVGASNPVYLMSRGSQPQRFDGKTVLDSTKRVLQFIPDNSLPLGETFEVHLEDVTDISGNRYQDDPLVGPRTFKTFLPYLLWQSQANILTGAKIQSDLSISNYFPSNVTLKDIDFKTVPPDESPDGRWHTTLYGVGYFSSDPMPVQLMTFDFSKPLEPRALSLYQGPYSRRYARLSLLKDFHLKPRTPFLYPMPPALQAWTQRELNYVDGDPGKRICIDPGDNPDKLLKWKSKYCPLGTGCLTKSGGCGDLLLQATYNTTYSHLRMFEMTNPAVPTIVGSRMLSDNGGEQGFPRKWDAPAGFGMAYGLAALPGIDITHNNRGNAPSTYTSSDTVGAYVANYGVGLALVDLGINIPDVTEYERDYQNPPYSRPEHFETLGTFIGPYYRDVGVLRGNIVAVTGDNTASSGSGVTTIETFAPDFTSRGMAQLTFASRELTTVENLFETKDAAGNAVPHDFAFITALSGGLTMAEIAANGTITGMDTFAVPPGADTRHVEVDKEAKIAYVSARWKDPNGQLIAGMLLADLTGTGGVVNGWDRRFIAKIPFTAPDGQHTIPFVYDFRIDQQRRLLYAGIEMQPYGSGQVPFAVLKLSAAAFDSVKLKDATLDPSTVTASFPSSDGLSASILATDLDTAGQICVNLTIDNTSGQQLTYTASEKPLAEGQTGYLDFSHGNTGDLVSHLCFDRKAIPADTDPYPTMLQLDVQSGGQFVRRLFVPISPARLIGYNSALTTQIDSINRTMCTIPDMVPVKFGITYDAKITIKIDGSILQLNSLDPLGNTVVDRYDNVQLRAGMHEVLVPSTMLMSHGEHPLEITAVFKDNPVISETFTGSIDHEISTSAKLPVGRTIVKGVDIYSGQVSVSRMDLVLPAVGPGLQFSRSYSSGGSSSSGDMGAGWGHNYESRLHVGRCGTYIVGGEGSGFRFTQVSALPPKYKPQAGYHGELIDNGNGTFDFFTKARIKHHYVPSYDPAEATGSERVYRLEYIEDPHGNKTRLVYQATMPFNLKEVVEEPLDLTGSPIPENQRRRLAFTYANGKRDANNNFIGFGAIPEDRLVKIEAFKGTVSLGIIQEYDYDKYGNLIRAFRDVRDEQYAYTDTDTRDRHNIKKVTDPNGNTVEYRWYAQQDPFPGENVALGQAVLTYTDKAEYLKELLVGSGDEQVATAYVYDFSEFADKVKTTVTARLSNITIPPLPQTFQTVYVMNPMGNVVETIIPGGNSDGTDNMVASKWAYEFGIQDVYLKEQTDGAGRRTVFDYDGNGNLLSETTYAIAVAGYAAVTDVNGAAVTSVSNVNTYDTCTPTFNKVATATDREGNVTENIIDCANGNILFTKKSSNGTSQDIVTGSTFWANGLVKTTTDPRGFVTRFDSYVYDRPEIIAAPEGLLTTNVYDDRGRLLETSDTFGHKITYPVYDNLDREKKVVKHVGFGSPNLVLLTEYYDNGQKKTVSDGLGTLSYILDSHNRVRSEETEVADADGATTTLSIVHGFDANENRVYMKDRRGIEHLVTYDRMNRPLKVQVHDPVTSVTKIHEQDKKYDGYGNLVAVKDIHGHETTYTFDWLYRSVKTVLPDTNYALVRSYDRVGNMLTSSDANGNTNVMTYDGVGRVKSKANPLGSTITYAYDTAGNETLMTNVTTGLIVRQDPFDGLGRPTKTYQEFTDPITGKAVIYMEDFSYDGPGNTRRHTNARRFTTVEKYNGLDKIYSRTVAEGVLDLTTTYTYDMNGNLAIVKDPEGGDADITNTYDSLNRIIRVAHAPVGGTSAEERFYYDGANNPIKKVNTRGIVTKMAYDLLGRPTKTTLVESITGGGAELVVEETVYDDAGNKTYVWDANRGKWEHRFNTLHQEYETVDPLGLVASATFDGVNRRSDTDRRNQKTEYDYDAVNRLVSTREFDKDGTHRSTLTVQYQDGLNREIKYDRHAPGANLTATGRAITQFDPLQRTRSVSVIHPDLQPLYGSDSITIQSSEFDAHGNVVKTTNANGHDTTYVFDAADRLEKRTDAAGTADAGITTFTYDKVGNPLTVKGPRNHGKPFDARYTYDARYRKTSDENALGDITGYTLDAGGNLLSVTKPLGTTITYAYDELGKVLLVDETAGGGGVTRYGYDALRNKVAQQNPNGNLTTFVYDLLNRQTDSYQHLELGSLSADSKRGDRPGGDISTALHWHFGYDGNGNQSLIVDPRSQRVALHYDYLDRMASRTYSNHQPGASGGAVYPQPLSHTYAYDFSGNLLKADEVKQVAAGVTQTESTLQTYDPLNRVKSKTNFDGKTVAYTYDRAGNRTSVTDSDGVVTSYGYDNRERIARMTTGTGSGSSVTLYSYLGDGLLSTTDFPNGTKQTMGYDPAARISTITNTNAATSGLISSYGYTYDANGNTLTQAERHSQVNVGAAESSTFTYDPLDRLSSASYPAGTLAYTYDLNGNRLTEKGTDAAAATPVDRTYRYDNLNRLLSVTNAADTARSVVYEYDANGNTVARTVGLIDPQTGTIAENSGKQFFDFDLRDKLVLVTQNGIGIVGYDYDFTGMRTRKTTQGSAVVYLYDQRSVLQEYDPASPVKETLKKFNYGRALHSVQTGGRTGFYLLDGLRSTSEITDHTGAVLNTYQYDAWGGFRRKLSLLDNDITFTGKYYESETGLHYFDARYYDSKTGRFLSQDPFAGDSNTPPSLHRYLYGHNNPLYFTDPTGLAVTNRGVVQRLFGVDSQSIEEETANNQSDGSFLGDLKQGLKSFELAMRETGSTVLYGGWNLVTGGFVSRQDDREEKLAAGVITESQYWGATAIDGGVSIASQVLGGAVGSKVTARLGTGVAGTALTGAAYGGFSNALQQSGDVLIHHAVSDRLGRDTVSIGEIAKTAALTAGLSLLGKLPELTKIHAVSSSPHTVRMAGFEKMQLFRPAKWNEAGLVFKNIGRRMEMMSRFEGGAMSWSRAIQLEKGLAQMPGNLQLAGAKWKWSEGFDPRYLYKAGVITKPGMYARIWGTRGINFSKNLLGTKQVNPELQIVLDPKTGKEMGRHISNDIDVITDDFRFQGDSAVLQALRREVAENANKAAGIEWFDTVAENHGLLPQKLPDTYHGKSFLTEGHQTPFLQRYKRTEHLFGQGSRINKPKVNKKTEQVEDSVWVGAREVINYAK